MFCLNEINFINSLNANGVHLMEFYMYKGGIIKYIDYLTLYNNSITRGDLRILIHVGIKERFYNDI